MSNVVLLGVSNDGFRNAFLRMIREFADRAHANAANGTPNTKRNAETLSQLAQFVNSLTPDDPRLMGIEAASAARGNGRATYDPPSKVQRLLASAGASLNGIAHSNEHLLNELLACEVAGLGEFLSERAQKALQAQQRAEDQRDQLVPIVEQRDALIRETERQSQQIAELENQLRESQKDIDYLRASLPVEKPKKTRAAA